MLFRSELGRRIAADYPWFGSGPGTFSSMYQVYRQSRRTTRWYAHNDWLETRITFGRIGAFLVSCALALALFRPLLHGGPRVPAVFLGLVWAGLGGCLVHARFDYPFQVHSILFIFLVASAAISIVSVRREEMGDGRLSGLFHNYGHVCHERRGRPARRAEGA